MAAGRHEAPEVTAAGAMAVGLTGTEAKPFIRTGLVVSIVGHAAAVSLGLMFAGARSFDAKPAEAITVDIVLEKDAPKFDILPPLEVGPAGKSTELAASTGAPASSPQPAPPKSGPPPQQQTAPPAQRPNPTVSVRQTAALPSPPPEPARQPSVASPRDEVPAHPGGMFALPLALPGGRLGGGFDDVAIETAKISNDSKTALRQRFKACAMLPAGIAAADDVFIDLRIDFKPDGTLAAAPDLIGGSGGRRQAAALALKQNAVRALEQCQPYRMLPPEKYQEWKEIDLRLTPQDFTGG